MKFLLSNLFVGILLAFFVKAEEVDRLDISATQKGLENFILKVIQQLPTVEGFEFENKNVSEFFVLDKAQGMFLTEKVENGCLHRVIIFFKIDENVSPVETGRVTMSLSLQGGIQRKTYEVLRELKNRGKLDGIALNELLFLFRNNNDSFCFSFERVNIFDSSLRRVSEVENWMFFKKDIVNLEYVPRLPVK